MIPVWSFLLYRICSECTVATMRRNILVHGIAAKRAQGGGPGDGTVDVVAKEAEARERDLAVARSGGVLTHLGPPPRPAPPPWPPLLAPASQFDPHLSIFSPFEVESMVEDETVDIIPNIHMDTLNMICGGFGLFFPQIPSKVPLWLAVALKKRGKCTIHTSEWMIVERLTHVLDLERESPREFQPLSFHYIEISMLLFDHAGDDISDAYLVSSEQSR
ncbi:DNA replication complex GINS protein PSF2-like [Phragmites australis]|uniref:DNA replication complex GINS protein PSF2-like n=1 Tax=Phragmites australis TaxID=29695 RepID=UPI002D7A1DC0|nr:DNA replication complex GINS protein PSF2-like [Phragmites australis]